MTGTARASTVALFVAFAAILAGCAQPSGSGAPQYSSEQGDILLDQAISMTTADHWKVWHSAGYVNAAVQSATADAVMTVQCSLEDKSVGLYVDPKAKLTGTRNDRTIIMRLDDGAPEQLDWITGPELYAIRNQDLGFVEVIEELKAARRTVEFVVSDSGKETMRHRFTLAEAATSIDAVFAACK